MMVSIAPQIKAPIDAQMRPAIRCGFAGFQKYFSCQRAEKDAHNAASANTTPMMGSNPSNPSVRQRMDDFIIINLLMAGV